MKNLLLLALLALFAQPLLALSPEQQGRDIFVAIDKRENGFGDTRADVKMILKNRSGDESLRLLEIKTLEVQNDGDKSLTLFDSPRDIKGTALLSFTHALTPDDQWLYLPALKRVKRIASANKSGPFLGSEYAFEDLTSTEIEKYSYHYLRDEPLDGIDCFVVELTPRYEHSGYTRQITWVDKARYVVLKTEYYDRKNALLKTQTFSQYQQYLGQYWRPLDQLMVNHQNGKSTRLLSENFQFRTGLTERDFDQNALKRSR
ncbi:MAG: outer membrane lipoprotein-sorting protein [Gammaproteobacteria bacterium HGW-Gammaproteobacteria-3]|nr:MAG: outer membrane lipoprotein-sorting protein [Gammaproteobacteria bacterium HGW-Gammaproteobacteria-3]